MTDLAIIDYFNGLDDKERSEFRTKVMDATGLAYSTFYNKMRGDFKFTKAEITVIAGLILSKNAD